MEHGHDNVTFELSEIPLPEDYENRKEQDSSTQHKSFHDVTSNNSYNITDEVRRQIIEEHLLDKKEQQFSYYDQTLAETIDFAGTIAILRDVVRAKNNWWRFLWSILAIVSVIILASQVHGIMKNYIIGQTKTQTTYTRNSTLTFPDVTVCTYARVNRTKTDQLGIKGDLLSYFLASFKGMYLFYNQYNQRTDTLILNKKYKMYMDAGDTAGQLNTSLKYGIREFFLKNGFSCDQFFQMCIFQGTTLPCCKNTEEILSDIGKCFILRIGEGSSGSSRRFDSQQLPGKLGGLRLFINNQADLYPKSMINTNPDSGIQLHITHPEKTSYIGVKLAYYKEYTHENCFTECVANMTKKTCGCVQIGALEVRPNSTDISGHGGISDEKGLGLPPVGTHASTSVWAAISFGLALVRPQQTFQETVKPRIRGLGTAPVDIFYTGLYYTKISEEKLLTYNVMLSNMGGQLSIWLGIRLMTFGHILYYGVVLLTRLVPVWYHRMVVQGAMKTVAAKSAILNQKMNKEHSDNDRNENVPRGPSIKIANSEIRTEQNFHDGHDNTGGDPKYGEYI